MGKVSNQFGGEATTVHLHFNIRQNVAGVGSVYVPTYLTLVKSYETLLGIGVAPDAGTPPAPEPTKQPPTVQETPVTTTDPTEPAPAAAPAEAAESGCTFAPTSGGDSRHTTWFGAGLALAALGIVGLRRHGKRAR